MVLQEVELKHFGVDTLSQMTQEEVNLELEKLRQVMINGSPYKESYALDLIDMFSKGKTLSQFCAAKEIGRETFNKWTKKHKLFALAYERAHDLARSYYDEMREKFLQNEVILETVFNDEGEPIQVPRKLEWNAFNKMYSARFNIPEKRTVKIKGLAKAKDEREILDTLGKAVEKEELTPEEAQKLLCFVDVSLKIKQTEEIEKRLSAIEQNLKA